MILTCPQCTSRYLLPAQSLAPEGRHVKCSSCEEIWFQLPDPDELAEFERDEPYDEAFEGRQEREQDFEDIPESVKPRPEDASMPALPEDVRPHSSKSSVMGIAISTVGMCVLILAGLLATHKQVMDAFPAARAFYATFGLSAPLPGEGIVFDKVQAKAEKEGEHEVLLLEGQVINLTSHQQKMPYIEASIKDAAGENLESWIIEMPVKALEKEGVEGFSSRYPITQEGGESLYLRFVLRSSKKAAAPEKEEAVHEEEAHGEEADKDAHHEATPSAGHHDTPSGH